LWNAGYPLDEFNRNGNTISFTFSNPHTPPPLTRKPTTDRIIQSKNQFLCEKFQEITGSSNTIQDKVKALEKQSPELYHMLIRTGKSKQSYETFSGWLTRNKNK